MCTKMFSKLYLSVSLVLILSLLVPATAWATAYTWTGTTSSAWNVSTNWTGGTFPNSTGDQATIAVSTNNPVSLITTAQLGISPVNTALTIGASGATALDIASGGTLGMSGNINYSVNTKKITIEAGGTLRNDGASNAVTYTISGAGTADITQLIGGTISSLNGASGGIWAFQRPIQGWGTISSPFTTNSTGIITANVSAQTLHITGNGTVVPGTLVSAAGAILSLESTLTASGAVSISHPGEVDLNGATLNGGSGTNSFSFNNVAGAIKVTGDSTIQGNFSNGAGTNPGYISLIGNTTLHLSGVTLGNTSGAAALFAVGTGTLDNTVGNTSISNGAPITLAGGQLTNTSGGLFAISTQIVGFGSVSGPLNSPSVLTPGSIKASGGSLIVDGTLGAIDEHGNTVFTNGVSGDVLDLKSNINFGSSGSMYSNNSGLDGSGVIQLDAAILTGTTINPSFASQGLVNVVNTSTLNGTYNSTATFGINDGKQFNIAGSTMNVRQGTPGAANHTGSLNTNNTGILAIGNGTFNNSDTLSYSLGGTGTATLAGGSITSTGGGGLISTLTLKGYGNVTAPFTNSGQVRGDGSGVEQTLAFSGTINETLNTGGMGWFAQNKGEVLLPFLTVNSATNYNWGGDPTTLKMVNSIGMGFAGPVTAGNLTVALLSTDRADVPAPGQLVDPIGVWSFNPGTLAFSSVSMTFRYDDALATVMSVNQNSLGLFGYDTSSSSWVAIPINAVDTTNKLVTTSSGLPAFYADFAIAEVPEPSTLVMACIGAIGMIVFARRRRA